MCRGFDLDFDRVRARVTECTVNQRQAHTIILTALEIVRAPRSSERTELLHLTLLRRCHAFMQVRPQALRVMMGARWASVQRRV